MQAQRSYFSFDKLLKLEARVGIAQGFLPVPSQTTQLQGEF